MVEHKHIKLAISLGVCLLAGYFNSLYVLPSIPTWFAYLIKPDFLPSQLYFVPIGLVVYLLQGFALYLIWHSDVRNYHEKRFCVFLITFSLFLNVLWAYTFFGLHSPFIALMIILLLFAILMSTIYQTLSVSFGATLLLLPYLIIVFIVAYTNYYIVTMNPNLPFMVI